MRFIVLIGTVLAFTPVRSQTLSAGQGQSQSLPRAEAGAALNRPQMPEAGELLALLRATVIALDQANQTGNYTVLRDLAAPDFRDANTASRLSEIFQAIRSEGIDLSPILNIAPELKADPAFDSNNRLRLAGVFPATPLSLHFDFAFQFYQKRWRPFTLSLFLAREEAKLQPLPAVQPKQAQKR